MNALDSFYFENRPNKMVDIGKREIELASDNPRIDLLE